MKLLQEFKKSPELLLEEIRLLREKKGNDKKVLGLVSEAILAGHSFVIELFWEEALIYQHRIMSELTKPDKNQDKASIKSNLKKWENVVNEAGFYIKKYELTHWKSRLHRYLGRVSDYKGDYNRAIGEYEKAILFVNKDPEYVEEKIPRHLELEAFLSFSTIMTGDIEKGLSMAKTTYKKFEETDDGKRLKREDMPTWIIWKTGIPIRTINALIDKGKLLDKEKMEEWLEEAENLIKKPAYSKKWKGEVDFGFRKDEINALTRRLSGV